MTTHKEKRPAKNLLISSTDRDMKKVLETVFKSVELSVQAADKAHRQRLEAVKFQSKRRAPLHA